MEKRIEKIRSELAKLPSAAQLKNDPELQGALDDFNQSFDELNKHPQSEEIRQALDTAIARIQQHGCYDESAPSGMLNRLTAELQDYEEAHPSITLLVSRLANALAVYGL